MRQENTKHVFEQVGRRLDRASADSLYWQTRQLVEQQIESRALRPGDRIPSQRTLSKLLGISEVTVRRAMQELAARGLIRSRVGSGTLVLGPSKPETPEDECGTCIRSVGIVYSGLSDGYPFVRPMIEGVERRCRGEVALQLTDLSMLGSSDPVRVDAVTLPAADALILESPVNLPLVLKCQQSSMPYVLQYSDLADGHSRCVVVDYTTGVLEAVGHLVTQRSRRRIALVTAEHQRFSTGKCLDAIHVAKQIYSLEIDPQWITSAGYDESEGYRATKRLLSLADPPQAILFASDYQARGGLIAAEEAGVRVPESLSIIGAGRLLREREWPVPISTIDLCFEEVGYRSMDMLCGLASGASDVPMRWSVPSKFIQGQTS